MKTRITLGAIVIMFALTQAGYAATNDGIQKYYNEAACKVKAATDPAQKREILNKSLQSMSVALDKVQSMPLVSQNDRDGIKQVKSNIEAKQSELMGTNGYERVADAQLNDFSDYVVQDMEQAPETITISVVTLLIILLIVVLIMH
jgi:hypothetical protein